jgi:hypothetical protein
MKRRDHSEDLGVDGNIISEWMLGKQGAKVWTGCIWIRIGTRRALVNMLMNLRIPQKARNFLTNLVNNGF